jgi:AI-2 transport protein TqsA
MITFPMDRATRLGVNVVILFAVVVALRLGESLFLPAIIALLLAAVLGPAALWLHQRLRFPWVMSCLSAVSLLVLLNVLVMAVFGLAMTRFVQVLPRPDDPDGILKLYMKFRPKLEALSPVELDAELFPVNPQSINEIQAFQNITDAASRKLPDMLAQVVWYGSSWFWEWIIVLVILFFLLLEGGMLVRRLVEIFGPSEEVQAKARTVLVDMAEQVKTYLVWRTIINFGLAIVVGTVYYAAGLNNPVPWAIMLAILNYIPYLGPLIAGVPPIIDALLSTTPLGAAVILAIYTAIIILEGYLIVPILMGRSMDLNATTVMLACLFWELIWGSMGLFLAMPLMAAIKAICNRVPGWQPWANLMSSSEEGPKPVILQTPVTLDGGHDAKPVAETAFRDGTAERPATKPSPETSQTDRPVIV